MGKRKARSRLTRRSARDVRQRRDKVRMLEGLAPLHRWEIQLEKLQAWRARVERMDTMQGEDWRRGQLRHIDVLIEKHKAVRPAA